MRRFGQKLRSGLVDFWWQAGERAMVDLANVGPARPMVAGLTNEAPWAVLYDFSQTKHRPSSQELRRFRKRWQDGLYVYEDDDELIDMRDDLREVFEAPET